jgi:hypothetical protein
MRWFGNGSGMHFKRARLNFCIPNRTVHVERKDPGGSETDGGAIVERLSAVDIFAPLSVEETGMLAQAAVRHVFAPGETVIRAGDEGSSMFVVHNGACRFRSTTTDGRDPSRRSTRAISSVKWPYLLASREQPMSWPGGNRSPRDRQIGDEACV